MGRLYDAVGRKPLFVGTLVIFLGGTVCCALAWSMKSLKAARAICGLGAGGLSTISSILINYLIPIK
jgi:predicted MFS family arabinose efflux permease